MEHEISFIAAIRLTACIAATAAFMMLGSGGTAQAEPAKSQPGRHGTPAVPKNAAQKTRILADLYERLAASENAESAEPLAAAIEQMWLYSGSETVNVLMERSLDALRREDPTLALRLLDGIVSYQPTYAEGWNRRAYVHFTQKDYTQALVDLQRVLSLDPRHFKALNGVATIMREIGQKGAALKAYRKLLDIHPHWSDAQQAVKELEREVEGENI